LKIAITGSEGLLGSSLKKFLNKKSLEILTGDRDNCNIASYESMKKFLNPNIDFLINCAAYTDVMKAEKEKKQAYLVNAQAMGILARVCLEYNIYLIHFSTDFIFDGRSTLPYTELDKPLPVNYYGLSKLHGERALQKKMKSFPRYTIFRLQWLYGDSEKTFFKKILALAQQEKILEVVSDEFGSPCSVDYISDVIYRLFFKRKYRQLRGKIFHLTHNDFCSRYQCAKYFLEKMKITKDIIPVKNLPSGKVNRPKFGVLNNSVLKKILKGRLGSWKRDLNDYITEIKKC